MAATLLKSFAASAVTGALLVGSVVSSSRHRVVPSILQVAGAFCLVVLAIAHTCEALRVFPWMGWGEERSIGYYLALTSAVLGAILFPAGYLLQAMRKPDPADK